MDSGKLIIKSDEKSGAKEENRFCETAGCYVEYRLLPLLSLAIKQHIFVQKINQFVYE